MSAKRLLTAGVTRQAEAEPAGGVAGEGALPNSFDAPQFGQQGLALDVVADAVGGSEASALLMGLPVARTIVLVYTFSGFCSALAGVVFTFYMLSGYGLHATGLELDAIAAVVIGGTLLTGGVGYVSGTLFGVLILGIIQTLISFDGSLSSWWTRIVIGALLFVFCLLQRLFESR